jgi:ABC-type transport system involved in multi-copper enzyme maturation permease subunit
VRAFAEIVRWELRLAVRRISTWVYFLIYFSIAFFFMLFAGGAWNSIDLALGSGGKVVANAPLALARLMPAISLLGISITAAVAGNALYRDYDSHTEPLFYTLPVPTKVFFGARFTGTLLVNLAITLGIGVGAWAAAISPWVKPDKIAAFHFSWYAQPYLTLLLPNLLLTVAIFFALVALTRQMLPNYVGGVVLLVGYLMSGLLLTDIADKHLAALLDPFGVRAQASLVQYWSIAEQNARTVPFTGVLLENRLIWIGVALLILVAAYWRFEFSYALGDSRAATPEPAAPGAEGVSAALAGDSATGTPALSTIELDAEPGGSAAELAAAAQVTPLRLSELPAVARRFDAAGQWAQFRSICARSFWQIVRSRYFAVLAGVGLLYLILALQVSGKIYGTKTWPVTYQIEEIVSGTFELFVVVILAFYAGELIWSERDVGLGGIFDATPVPDGVILFAKFVALSGVVAALLVVSLIAGVGTQLAQGYYRIQPGLYLEMLGFRFMDLLLVVVLAMVIHVLVNHKYLGHLVVILSFIGMSLLPSVGLEHNLFVYSSDPGLVYSDMNGWGPFVWPYVAFKVYWGACAALLLVLATLYWVRGGERGLRSRARLARRRFTGRLRVAAAVAAGVFVLMGGLIFYNTNILNVYRTGTAERHLRADRERLYSRYARVPQPRITSVSLAVDLYPSRLDFAVRGTYVLRNETRVPIDSIHLGVDEELRIDSIAFDRPATRVLEDRPRNYLIYRLAAPLAPGDSVHMRFGLTRITRGFPNRIQLAGLGVMGNGTFLEDASFMPSVGYDARLELTDDDARKKEHLRPKAGLRPPWDSTTWRTNYVSPDADWIHYDAVVSTDADQMAITSGTLERAWTANGRRYFHYHMDAPIIDLWAFQSAHYAVAHDTWHDVSLEIDYDIVHDYDIGRMLHAMRRALDYYTRAFGPYQFHQLRIVEFPRYASFAQSLPNTVPYSEGLGFIARVSGSQDIDYPFYVTAHEVAHQWWAHQLVGADAQGATVLSETLAQYSALMVMEHEFGSANMRRFLEYELNSYLTGRATERRHELPLELAENQPYIHYNKGSLVMYALRDYIGEDRMNAAIRGFLDAHKFGGPPYPTSLELVRALRAATPDSLQYVIHDLFETITLYQLKADSAVARPSTSAKGSYDVDLWITAKKMRADTLGAEKEVPMHDWVDVGLFAKPDPRDTTVDQEIGRPLSMGKHLLVSGSQKVSLTVPEIPYRAGVDPLHKLIDRITLDNTIGVSVRSR